MTLQENLNKIDEITAKAEASRNTLFKIANGFYVFVDDRGKVWDAVDYHDCGIREWQVRARTDNNWAGSYPSLKEIIKKNELVRA